MGVQWVSIDALPLRIQQHDLGECLDAVLASGLLCCYLLCSPGPGSAIHTGQPSYIRCILVYAQRLASGPG